MHAVTRPVNRMSTVSIRSPSASVSKYFRVNPSDESVSSAVGKTPSVASASSRARTFAGNSGIASAVNNAVARVAGLIAIALLATIVGGALDLEGFHRSAIVTAVLMIAGGITSFFGIRNPDRAQGSGIGAP